MHAEWYRSTAGKETDEGLLLIGPLIAGLIFLFVGLGVASGVISLRPRGSAPPPSNSVHPTADTQVVK